MLKAEENDLLTQVGPGTPCGDLLRRYWQPVCYAEELRERPTLAVRVMHEDLVVYRDGEDYGVLGEHCAHRGTSLAYGFVEPGCVLRCPYHGWAYDASGAVVDTPFEPNGSRFKARITQQAYPAQELGGLVFAYLGPDPAPLLPRWDVLVRTDGERVLSRSPVLECNWLQAQENSADTVHTYFLHAQMLKQQGLTHPGLAYYDRPFVAYGFHAFEWGLLKSFVTESAGKRVTEIGNPLIFPNALRVAEGPFNEAMHWRVPVDDENTLIFHAALLVNRDGSDTPAQRYPRMLAPQTKRTADGRYAMNDFFPQDWMAWETQGRVFDRSKEKLGASDRGIAMYRRMLRENIETAARGEDPMALVRDPAMNERIDVDTMVEDPSIDVSQLIEVEQVLR